MAGAPPSRIAIDRDDDYARHVGRTADGRLFFLTTPFEHPVGGRGNEFIALYLFDADGKLLEARIDELGSRAELDEERARELYQQRLRELGPVQYGRIEIEPFALERFGTTFGLVVRPLEEDEDQWAVEAQPGNYMAFFAPWDSGEYDT